METRNVINNEQRQQFQLIVEGEIAFLEYRIKEGIIFLMHTEVPENLGGRGFGSALAAAAFDYAKTTHLKVKVYCPFVQSYLKRHPDLNSLLADTSQP